MKTKLPSIASTLAIVSLFCLIAVSSRATIVLQDNFDSYATGNLTNNSGGFWLGHSGVAPFNVVADSFASAPNAAQVNQTLAQDVHALLTNGPYADPTGSPAGTNALGNPVTALYASMSINVTSIAFNGAETYFTHFEDSGTFKGRVFIITNGAASGSYRLAIQNAGVGVTNAVPMDLSPNTGYTIVTRYVLGTGICTLWVNPNSETNSLVSTNGADAPSVTSVRSYAFRQSTGEGIVDVDNLKVGTSFADVVSGSVNPPSILLQPVDNTTAFEGNSAQFKTLAGGDATISYQWYYNTNTLLSDTASIIGSTSNVLTLTGLAAGQSGMYSCVATNAAGTNVTRYAVLVVNTVPIPPIITNQPVATTIIVGDTANFSVVAGGSQPLAYKWRVDNGTTTNDVAGAGYSGTNTAALAIFNASQSLSGLKYFVTITNQFGTTNSAKALLTVNPPPAISIAQFRAKVDGSFAPTNTTANYTLTGTVTTWHDMTGLANTEFYMQDASGGIVVFWSGADGSTNLPPAGASVRVTGPMAAFNGLLEIEPVFTNTLHSVTILSTGNPLPKAQPLPFDPNVSLYPATAKNATMDKLESMYLVASNVMLNLSTPTFASGANDFITNNVRHVLSATNSVATINFTNQAGQQFVLFVNAQSGLPGQAKYTGPVTIYGVLGYFTSAGYEFTPSRFEDIISYNHVTNTVTNVKHYGDLLTNSYAENVLRNGETFTEALSIADPEGGTVTLTPSNTGLPTGASWSGVTSGSTASAIFHYKGTNVDDGNNYTMNVGVSSTSGSSSTYSFTVYVPSADEQKVAITEFLANPTTNTSAANFNPLNRSSATAGANTNDEYIEVANQSLDDIDTSSGANGWEIDQGNTQIMVFDALGSPPLISSSNAIVIYGGGSPPPSLSVNSYASTASQLGLPVSGTGTIILRNGDSHIVDRVVYSASDLNTNGSLTRFPTMDSPFAPQPYVGVSSNSAGLQYDGSAWNQPYKVPSGVSNVGVKVVNGQVIFNFTANTSKASTLWSADSVSGPYTVLFGKKFSTTTGAITNTAATPMKFYYISTQ